MSNGIINFAEDQCFFFGAYLSKNSNSLCHVCPTYLNCKCPTHLSLTTPPIYLQQFPTEKSNLCRERGGEATSCLTSVDTRFEWLVKHVTTALSKFSTCCSFIIIVNAGMKLGLSVLCLWFIYSLPSSSFPHSYLM